MPGLAGGGVRDKESTKDVPDSDRRQVVLCSVLAPGLESKTGFHQVGEDDELMHAVESEVARSSMRWS